MSAVVRMRDQCVGTSLDAPSVEKVAEKLRQLIEVSNKNVITQRDITEELDSRVNKLTEALHDLKAVREPEPLNCLIARLEKEKQKRIMNETTYRDSVNCKIGGLMRQINDLTVTVSTLQAQVSELTAARKRMQATANQWCGE